MSVNCRKCKHFYVTWDPKSPYGCKAMSFKTSMTPALLVKKQTGEDCVTFEEKRTSKNKAKDVDLNRKDIW